MIKKLTRRSTLTGLVAAGMLATSPLPSVAADMTFTLATSGTETDMRSVAMANVFAPMVASFAKYKPGYNGSLFAQGTELEAISRGNLTMSIASAQELAQFSQNFPFLQRAMCIRMRLIKCVFSTIHSWTRLSKKPRMS